MLNKLEEIPMITTKLMKIKKRKIYKARNLWKEEIKNISKGSKFFVKMRFARNFHLKLQENVTNLNSNSKQTIGRINLKPTRVTPAVVKVLDVVTFCFWVSDAPCQKNWKRWKQHFCDV